MLKEKNGLLYSSIVLGKGTWSSKKAIYIFPPLVLKEQRSLFLDEVVCFQKWE